MEKGLSVLTMSCEHFSVHAASARSFSYRIERENISILYTKTYEESKAQAPGFVFGGEGECFKLTTATA